MSQMVGIRSSSLLGFVEKAKWPRKDREGEAATTGEGPMELATAWVVARGWPTGKALANELPQVGPVNEVARKVVNAELDGLACD